MTAPIAQRSFSGGEISPLLYGRTDLIKYEAGLRTMRNMIAMRHGSTIRRPGTQYVGTTLNGGNPVRLIPFIFNETGNGQSYVLEFGNQYIAFIQNGVYVAGLTPNVISLYSSTKIYNLYDIVKDAFSFLYISVVTENQGNNVHNTSYWAPIFDWSVVTNYNVGDYVIGMVGASETGGYYVCTQPNVGINPLTTQAPYWKQVASNYAPYTVSTPYVQADLATLNYAESADVMTIAHNNYAPRELKRINFQNWTLTAVTTGSSVPQPFNIRCTPGGTGWSGTYFITAISKTGEESEANFLTLSNVAAPTPAAPHIILWDFSFSPPFPGVSEYKIYLNLSNSGTDIPGYIGSATDGSFRNAGFTPDFTNTPPQPNTLFNSVSNYPAIVGFAQQRRYFANTLNNPVGFWGSQPGFFANFDYHIVPLDSDPVIGSIAGTEVNAIQNLLELKFMLMLTSGAEIYVQGNGTGVVTPNAINASTQSQYGCSTLKTLKVADTIIFNQALGSFVRDFGFDFAIDGYRGNDISVFSSHLLEGYSINDWDFQKIPDSIIWAVRNDGILLGLTYVREQQILAWHRHDFVNGTVENVCCIPENGNYATYVSVARVINGSTVRYIERMSSRIWTDELNATYLDCFKVYNGINTGSTTMTLTSPTGTFTTDGTAYQQKLTLISSANYFTSNMVGKQIFLSDSAFVANKGNMVDPENDGTSLGLPQVGNQVRCTIVAYISATQVTVTPNTTVETSIQNTPLTTWALAINRIVGLDHLIEQNVSVWADRFVVASPYNQQISFTATVASDGSLTLDKWYAVVYVGLPIISDIETLDIDTSFGEAIIGKRMRQNRLNLNMYNTRSLFAGSQNPDTNFDNLNNDPLFQLFEYKSGENRQTYDQAPQLLTERGWILEESRYNKNGRIFIRNIDPTPLTILAVVPSGDSVVDSPFYKRV